MQVMLYAKKNKANLTSSHDLDSTRDFVNVGKPDKNRVIGTWAVWEFFLSSSVHKKNLAPCNAAESSLERSTSMCCFPTASLIASQFFSLNTASRLKMTFGRGGDRQTQGQRSPQIYCLNYLCPNKVQGYLILFLWAFLLLEPSPNSRTLRTRRNRVPTECPPIAVKFLQNSCI